MSKKSNLKKEEQPKKGGLLNKLFGSNTEQETPDADKVDGNAVPVVPVETATPGVVRHNPFKEALNNRRANKAVDNSARDKFADKLANRSDEFYGK